MPRDRYPFAPPFDDPAKAERALKTEPSDTWIRRGEHQALQHFKAVSERVPAYKDFLKKNKIRAGSVRTISDFSKLPPLNKDNYLKKYSRSALSWDGNLMKGYQTYAATSGSTGQPYYFPRSGRQVDQYAMLAELYLRSQFRIQERTTLYMNCFAMGSWIGGLFTFEAIERLAERGKYPIHQITPGLAKDAALKAFRVLAPSYDQIIIGGYPPFVKDLIEEGAAEGIIWKKHDISFIFSAEGFSERFRDHISGAVGQKNILNGSLNHYGTVDLGTMAYESPVAALIRRNALINKNFYAEFFGGATRLPTLAQYLPEHFYFESMDGGLLCTANSGFPLVRYDLKDQGGLSSFDDAMSTAKKYQLSLNALAKQNGIANNIFKLPFVYIYERKDFAVVLYGANIYPEHIRTALEHSSTRIFSTGKCTVRIIESRSREPRLEVNVELKKGIHEGNPHMKRIAEKVIIETLLRENTEFRSNWTQLPKKMVPRIKFWPYGDVRYFSLQGKQKWKI